MVNIFNYAKKVKQKAKSYRDNLEHKRAIKTANELKELRQERLKKEGRLKVYKIKEKEQAKLKEANLNLRKRTPAYRVINALKDNMKKNKERNKNKPSLIGRMEFN